MAKIILSAFADEYDRDIDVQLQMLRDNGIGYLEPRFINEKNIADFSVTDAKMLKEKLGEIKVSSLGSPLGKIKLSDDFEKHLETAKRVFETANILGTQNVRAFSFYLHEGRTRVECREEVLYKLGRMIELAKSYDIILCHENEAEIYGESPMDCLDLLKNFNGKFKCVFDMGNFVLGGYKPFPDAYDMLKDYIQYFHIKDALYEGAVVPPGCGNGSIGEILKHHMTVTGKDVLVTLEPHLQTFDGINMLIGKSFENPYKYETKEIAFLDAIDKFRAIVEEM
ncbi:MAG: sugar phosphate isomerase/epimerase [Lachnospiraceae bacterium]|nr:sugar phosphate isomerase/epimerase [Lachnospiraceae bacterium]